MDGGRGFPRRGSATYGLSMEFRPLTTADLPLTRTWLARPHVAEWWDGPIALEPGLRQVLAALEGEAIGYAQSYQAVACHGDGWWLDVDDPGVHGIDGTSLAPTAGPATSLGDLLQAARRAGAKYLVTGAILEGGSKVSVDLYSTGTGERIAHHADTASGPRLDGAIGRLAFQSLTAIARPEGLDVGGGRAVLASTSSIAAAGHLLRGQTKFWQDDYAAAAEEFRAAVAADSECGLAYHRLGVAETWQHDYPADHPSEDR